MRRRRAIIKKHRSSRFGERGLRVGMLLFMFACSGWLRAEPRLAGDRMVILNSAATTLEKPAMRVFCLALMLAAMPRVAIAADKMVLQLHRGAPFEFAGYYAALWEGFYQEAGIDVQIKPGVAPGVAPVDAVREVIEKRAQFGTGTTQLLVAAAQGSPLVL